jgi:long-chain acyl-CoA synthetase
MMEQKPWLTHYPLAVPHSIDADAYHSINDLFHQSCRQFAAKPAYSNFGKTMDYAELNRLSGYFAAYLQQRTKLRPGDRLAIQLPNLLQYPVVLFGALRAGLVVVNINPLYTAREVREQLQDSEAKALVVLANMAHVAEQVVADTAVEWLFVTRIGDLLGPVKGPIVNAVVKYIKKMVPAYRLPQAISLPRALRTGAKLKLVDHQPQGDDLAILQYTGGTTGTAKAAMLSHRNLVANMLQIRAFLPDHIIPGQELIITPLPLYHIFSFTVNCLAIMATGNHSVLITNPRDIKGFVKELKKWRFSLFTGLNTLFAALCRHPEFSQIDFSSLKLTVAGGMALQPSVAQRWQQLTGCAVIEGYGLTEASPVVSVNPPEASQLGTIGIPLPSTEVKVIDEQGTTLVAEQEGELCVRGPQVMAGYWRQSDETAQVLDDQGWLRTGDIACLQEDGYIRILDRKKDMIIISGFNVYPNEVEAVVAAHPDVEECAVVGVADADRGQQVKLFVVTGNKQLASAALTHYCRQQLTSYKVPKIIEFCDSLPKTTVGKVLRRALKDSL